jgi:maltoporin
VNNIAPAGQRGRFARPHLRLVYLRLVYTIAFYNDAAQNLLMSPYLANQGARAVGHYVGVKTEWWF